MNSLITKEKIEEIQQEWGKSLVKIGRLFSNKKD